jgi:hypothetical protein
MAMFGAAIPKSSVGASKGMYRPMFLYHRPATALAPQSLDQQRGAESSTSHVRHAAILD